MALFKLRSLFSPEKNMAMGSILLEQFLKEECTPCVRGLLKEVLGAATLAVKRFEFNRFEVTINREDDTVLIEDVLDASAAGSLRVQLTEFAAALVRNSE